MAKLPLVEIIKDPFRAGMEIYRLMSLLRVHDDPRLINTVDEIRRYAQTVYNPDQIWSYTAGQRFAANSIV